MIVETIQMLTDALNDDTYGVSTQITGSITAYDETRNAAVALGSNAEPYPSLSVRIAEPIELEGEVFTNIRDTETTMDIQISYVGREIDTPNGVTTMYEVMHGITKTLREWLRNSNEADRIRNNIQIASCTKITVQPNITVSSDAIIPGGIIASLYVRDIAGV